MNEHSFGTIGQIAYLVGDLDSSIDHWSRYAGIGPWTVYKNVTMNGHWRGQDTVITMNVGLSYQDDLQIELIEVTSDTISPYQHLDGGKIIGMHHMAWMIEDFDAHVAKAKANGMTQVFFAENPASKVAYFEASGEPGILFEFIQTPPMIAEGFAQGRAASRAWDGKEKFLQVIDFAAM
jgi:hypothetical protein